MAEETLAKGARMDCGHLVAKGRRVFDGRCFDCRLRGVVKVLHPTRGVAVYPTTVTSGNTIDLTSSTTAWMAWPVAERQGG